MDAQPIAYEVVSEQGREAVYAADLRANAERACLLNGWRLVPLYESRPIPAGSPPCRNGRSLATVPRRSAPRHKGEGDEGAGIK